MRRASMTIRLDSRHIHLWLSFCDTITETDLLARYRALLSEEERKQEGRFHFARDRHRYLVSRALLRTTLSRYVDAPAQLWTFTTNPYGKPAIANDDPCARRLSFSLSHTTGLVVLGVAQDVALGVDAEDIHARTAPLEIADRYFAPEEAAQLRALPLTEQALCFFQYWTLKEAYIKARGLGLSLSLDRLAFDLRQPQHIDVTARPGLEDAPEDWRFWQFCASSAHMISVCAPRESSEPPDLLLRSVIPLVSEADVPGSHITARRHSK